MLNKILNWLTNMRWSTSPYGIGCIYPKCIYWNDCKKLRYCEARMDKENEE